MPSSLMLTGLSRHSFEPSTTSHNVRTTHHESPIGAQQHEVGRSLCPRCALRGEGWGHSPWHRSAKVFADAERRSELDTKRQIATAQHVTEELGQMKGALMKLGQMASYLDDALPEPLRAALATLQNSAPPMSAELASAVLHKNSALLPINCSLSGTPRPSLLHQSGKCTAPSSSTKRPVKNGRSQSRCSTPELTQLSPLTSRTPTFSAPS